MHNKAIHLFYLFALPLLALISALVRPIRSQLSNFETTTALINPTIWLVVIIILFFIFVSFNQPVQPTHPQRTTGINLLALAVLLIPSSTLSWVVLSLLCGYALYKNTLTKPEKIALTLLLALGIRDPISQLLLGVFAEPILFADTWITTQISNLFFSPSIQNGNLIINSKGETLAVMTGCCSVQNISYALLAWFSLLQFSKCKASPIDGLLLCFSLLLLNSFRLGFMAQSNDWYQWLHNGSGSDISAAIQLTITLLFVFKGLNHERS